MAASWSAGFARVLTNRDGKNLVIESKEADIKLKSRRLQASRAATFKGDVRAPDGGRPRR